MSRDAFRPLYYEHLPVGSQPILLASVPQGAHPSGAAWARFQVETAPIRFIDTGATPNASLGHLVNTTDAPIWYDGGPEGLAQLRVACPSAPTAMLHVTYYS